jgi:TonB family protein
VNRNLNQNFIFASAEINPPRSWRSHVVSATIHILALIILLLIPIAVSRNPEVIRTVTTLIAPRLNPYKPKVMPPKIERPKTIAKLEIPPKLIPRPKPEPIVAPPVVKQPIEQPKIAEIVPKPLPKIAAPEPAPAPVLRPQIHTGVFEAQQAAKKVEDAKQLKVGGFGDPNGVQPSPQNSNPTLLASVGSFDKPIGENNGGGKGGAGQGVVRQTAFGNKDGSGSGPGGNGAGIGHGTVRASGFGAPDGGGTGNGAGGAGRLGTVKTGGFGATATGMPVQTAHVKQAEPSTTPVEILSKPKPVYSPEARSLKLEGEVSLEVVFAADGSVQVVRVVRGLGHGLDESAQRAASQIKFRPSTRDGVPVDTRATIHITFELT